MIFLREDTMKSNQRSAFTLIELMVVITIIGILVAILLPVIGAVFTSGEKAQARAEVHALEIAARKYYDDFNDFPAGTGEPGQKATQALVELLSGGNSKKKIYMEFKESSIKDGFFVDPWGYPYWISTDTNLDGMNGTGKVRKRVLVWSGGPDGKPDAPNEKDNVASW